MDLEERFKSLTGDQIVAMIREQETLHIEFKLWSPNDRDNRKYLSEAVSGFSNSDGGLVVWGVEARRGDDGIDQVVDAPRLDADRVLNQLNEWTADVVAPRQAEVDHRVVRASDNRGFVISYVPATVGDPVMAQDKRHYHRCGTRFMQMEQYHVSNMYGRRAKPQLVVDVRIRNRKRIGTHWGLWLSVSVQNVGRAAAHHPQVIVGLPFEPESVSGGPGWDSVPSIKLPTTEHEIIKQTAFASKETFPIHVGVSRTVGRIDTDAMYGVDRDLVFVCVGMCDSAPPARHEVIVKREHVDEALRSDSKP